MKELNLLKKTEELELMSKEYGFYWENLTQIMEQIRSECDEVEEAYGRNDRPHLQEEIGDLIHAALSLTVFCGMDPFETLQKSTSKYENRFRKLQEFAQKDGLKNLRGASFKTLMDYWNKAKEATLKSPS